MALTPQQVAEKKFTSTRFKNGYDEGEVDAFLDEVEAELTRLHDESATLRRQLESAQLSQATRGSDTEAAAVEPPSVAAVVSGESTPSQGEMEEMLRRTLILAQRTADEVVAEAKADAERQLREAQAHAERLRTESEQQAREAEQATTTRVTVSLAEFEADKRRIEEQIASLHAFERDFRGRLRAYLELQLSDLDRAKLVPAGAPAPARTVQPAAPAAPAPAPPAPPADEADPAVASQEVEAGVAGAPDPGRGDTAVLPDLPPLPSWMSADAGFSTDNDAPVAAPPPPEGA